MHEQGASRPVECCVFQQQHLWIFSVKALQLLGTSHHCWAHRAHPGWLILCDRAGQESWMCEGSQMDIFVILICSVAVFRDHTPANVSFCNSWKSQKWKPFQFLQPCLCGRLSHFWDFLGNLSGIRLFPQASRKINIFFVVLFSRFTNNMRKATWKTRMLLMPSKEAAKKITQRGKQWKNMCNSLGNSYFLIFTFVSQFSKLQYFLFRFTAPTLYLCFFLITDQYNKTCLYVTTCLQASIWLSRGKKK